jgi:hypothetical protein
MDGNESRLDGENRRGGLLSFIEWLNEKIYRAAGPPPLGPYDPVVERVAAATCPVCGRPMAEHTIDHSTRNTILNCPVPHTIGPFDDSPLNELGMPKPADAGN